MEQLDKVFARHDYQNVMALSFLNKEPETIKDEGSDDNLEITLALNKVKINNLTAQNC